MDQQPRKRLLCVGSRIGGVWDVRHAGTTAGSTTPTHAKSGLPCRVATVSSEADALPASPPAPLAPPPVQRGRVLPPQEDQKENSR